MNQYKIDKKCMIKGKKNIEKFINSLFKKLPKQDYLKLINILADKEKKIQDLKEKVKELNEMIQPPPITKKDKKRILKDLIDNEKM